jgi:murein DD-endopeptidase MepM/ murein hydrolase activator NlpD
MGKKSFFVLIVNSNSAKGIKRLKPNKFILSIFLILFLISMLGIARATYFISSYGMAKLSMYFNEKLNAKLRMDINFYSKYVEKKKRQLKQLSIFEDRLRLQYGMAKISEDIRKAGVGGIPLNNDIVKFYEDPIVVKADSLRENLINILRMVKLQDSTFSRMTVELDKKINYWAQKPAIQPVWGRLTSYFGYRIHPIMGYRIFHEGIDISNNLGTPIKVTANGIVSFVGYKEYYGNVVEIKHPASDFKTVYAHLKKYSVFPGQVVKRGDIIGYMGNSGRSTGTHLHYEVHKSNELKNPLDYILPSDTMVD